MDLSVIISNCNYARFLDCAIRSVLAQRTARSVQLIVIDDGSTDDSARVLHAYGRSITSIFKENGGQASALNAGYRVCTGRVIVFLDADDFLAPDAAEAILTSWHEEIARIQYPLEVVDESGNPLGWTVGARNEPKITEGPFAIDTPTSGNAFARKILDEILPIPEDQFKICADAYLNAASSLLGRVVSLKRPLGGYRRHSRNNFAARDDLEAVRRAIVVSFGLHAALVRLASGKIGSLDEWLSRYPQHWVERIVSLRESPSDHPMNDRLPDLIATGLRATWLQPYWNFGRKLAYSPLVFGYGVLPLRMVRVLRRIEGRAWKPRPGRLPQGF